MFLQVLPMVRGLHFHNMFTVPVLKSKFKTTFCHLNYIETAHSRYGHTRPPTYERSLEWIIIQSGHCETPFGLTFSSAQNFENYPLVNVYITVENHHFSSCVMGKSTISMAIFQFAFCMFTRPGTHELPLS